MSDEISKTVYKKVGDALDVVIKPLNERMSNPLIGSFTISWVILNWRPIIFLIFSSKTIEEKFTFIHDNFYDGQFILNFGWYMYFIFPLLISCFYVLGTPRIENFVEQINRKPINRKLSQLHNAKLANFKKLKVIASEEAAVAEAKSEYKTLLQKDELIKELSERVELLENQETELHKTINSLLEESKRIQNENINLNKNRIDKDSNYERQLIDLASLTNKLIQNVPTKILHSFQEEVKTKLENNNEEFQEVYYQIVNSIEDTIALSESKNPLFVLRLEIAEDHLDSIEMVADIIANLFELISHLELSNENVIEFVCRFKNPNDRPEMYDFILDSLPFITSVRFSNPEFLKNGKIRYKS